MRKFSLDLTKLIGFKIAASDKAQAVLSTAKIGAKTEITADANKARKSA